MQQLNDDMDELFRRAAENYPLQTNNADWDAVNQKLVAGINTTDLEETKSKNRYWLLLLLIPLGFGYFMIHSGNKIPIVEIDKKISANTTQNLQPALNKNSVTKQQSNQNADKKLNPINSNFPENKNQLPIAINKDERSKNTLVVSSHTKIKTKAKLNSSISSDNVSEEIKISNDINVRLVMKEENKTDQHFSDQKNNADKVEKVSTGIQKNTNENSIANENVITNKAAAPGKQKKNSSWYAGPVISPDISFIKFQSVKKVGIGVGFFIGYKINKKMSMETGAAWSKKNYYTDGKYFSTKNIRLPATAKINYVQGVCKMIEVPLNIQYKFSQRKAFFSASAGISAYFMKKESYDYSVVNNGQQYPYSSTYSNSSNNLLAVVNMGTAYNVSLKKNINIRLEPYIKIPLKGIGIGSLPIMSSGINISLLKNFSK